jgi:hypothetical protein
MVHMIPVPKADSTITIELTPIKDYNHNLTLLLRCFNENYKKKTPISCLETKFLEGCKLSSLHCSN